MIHILVVDDDDELLEMVDRMIKANNMTAKCISSGPEVFPTLERESVDLILMDIYLGNYDGRQLTRQLKTDERFHHIPILLYSAGSVTQQSIMESLANDFIQKPFDMSVLIGKMREMVVA